MSQPQRNHRAATTSTENQSVTRKTATVRAAAVALIAAAALAGCSARTSHTPPAAHRAAAPAVTDAVVVTDGEHAVRIRPGGESRDPGEQIAAWGQGGHTDGLPAPFVVTVASGRRVTVVPRSPSGSLLIGPPVWDPGAGPFEITGGCGGVGCSGEVGVTPVRIVNGEMQKVAVDDRANGRGGIGGGIPGPGADACEVDPTGFVHCPGLPSNGSGNSGTVGSGSTGDPRTNDWPQTGGTGSVDHESSGVNGDESDY